MKPTYHHYSALTIAFVIFVISISGYIFIYYSIYDQAARTADTNGNIAAQQSAEIKERQISDSIAATVSDRALVSTFLISPNATVPFIDSIEGIGSQTGSKVTIVSISNDTGTLTTHININGSWKNVMRAMHLVENIPYSLRMDNVRMSLQTGGQWNEDFDISIPLAITTPSSN